MFRLVLGRSSFLNLNQCTSSMEHLNWHCPRKCRTCALYIWQALRQNLSSARHFMMHWGCRDEWPQSPYPWKSDSEKTGCYNLTRGIYKVSYPAWSIAWSMHTPLSAIPELIKKTKFLGTCLWQNDVHENLPSLVFPSWVSFGRWLCSHHPKFSTFTTYPPEAPFAQNTPLHGSHRAVISWGKQVW